VKPVVSSLLLLPLVALATGCASTGAVPKPFPSPVGERRPVRPPGNGVDTETAGSPARPGDARGGVPDDHGTAGPPIAAAPLLDTALAHLGTPYRNGGSSPGGFDCSGFTQWVFAQHGLALPRETREQYGWGAAIDAHDIAPGDLIFFSTVAPGASHVGIALDADRFVHAPSARGVVRIERRSSTYWRRRYLGARRPLAPSASRRVRP